MYFHVSAIHLDHYLVGGVIQLIILNVVVFY